VEKFEKAVAETPKAFYATLLEDLTSATEEFSKLTAELSKRCGDRAPPSSSIRDALVSSQDVIKSVAKSKLDVATTAAGPGAANGPPGQTPAGGAGQVDVLGNREDACKILLKVADYFRRTEPHNPVSYALEQAVRWTQMSLPELLSELLEEGPRKSLFKQVGIKPPEAKK
jgi:type VI secretion system protein ImpA